MNFIPLRGVFVKRFVVLGVLGVSAALLAVMPAAAQPVQPAPTTSAPMGDLLASAPHRDISNLLMTARLASAKRVRRF